MSTFGSSNPRDLLREGDDLLVRIISIEPERQRIGMSVDDVTVEEQEEWMRGRQQETTDAVAEELGEEIEDYGDVPPASDELADEVVEDEDVDEAEAVEEAEEVVEAEEEPVVEAEAEVEVEAEAEPVAEETTD